ncbi:hypothetical protein [Actinokineospora inagensis]|uniref:hypothetical protein n=1 Tax=Actinokineospora inagensis TaxID=103730 RepID=UPI000423D250|nr:hypothetical protein [Actinokineospora inagensis]
MVEKDVRAVLAGLLPGALVVLALAITAAPFAAGTGSTRRVVLGGLYLVQAVVFLVSGRASGPGRFAGGVLVVAVAVGLTYLQAITGAGALAVVLGAVFAVAAIAGISLSGARPGQPAGNRRAVR